MSYLFTDLIFVSSSTSYSECSVVRNGHHSGCVVRTELSTVDVSRMTFEYRSHLWTLSNITRRQHTKGRILHMPSLVDPEKLTLIISSFSAFAVFFLFHYTIM